MQESGSNNAKIVKNTIFLYIRMILLTVINIFTVRIVLNALGVEDYGIYSVISSAVLMLGFIQGTLSSATQRYFSFQLAQNDIEGFRKLFSLIMICFMTIALLVLIVGGIAGPYVVHELNIPANREEATLWVYYSSLGSFIFGLITIPFTATMISHERMNGFAYLSIFDGIFKLAVAFATMYTSYDHLVYYAILSLIQSLVIWIIYAGYCRKYFEGVRFSWYWEKNLLKELLSYTGWNLFGSVSGVLSSSGQGIVLNLFFGPIVNAAKGISDRIYSVVQSFSTNFFLAVSPQIVKSYATGDLSRMQTLVISSTKFSYYLLLLICYPLIICMEGILNIWLKAENVDNEMIIFSQLALLLTLVSSLEQPITQMIRATGKIKRYQLSVGIFTLMYLPLVIFILWLGAPAPSSMIALILLMLFVQGIRVWVANRQMGFPVAVYLKKAIMPLALVSLLLTILYFPAIMWETHNIGMHIVKGLIALTICALMILFIGMNRQERIQSFTLVKNKLLHKG